MRIVLHAGLHKSATTYTQSFWGGTWGEPGGSVLYPVRRGKRASGHHYLFRPLVRAFAERVDPDLVLTSLTSSHSPDRLAVTVRKAHDAGTEHLVLSAEILDRVVPEDVPAIAAALAPHEVTLVLTVTAPVHRWCANWQTLVRRGLTELPASSAPLVERVAALTPGRLEQLLRLLPASRRVVSVMRTSPPDPGLPRTLALALGLPDPGAGPDTLARNVSLGEDTDVVRRLSRAGLAMGALRGGEALLREVRGDGFAYRDLAPRNHELAISDTAWQAARAERAFLRQPPADLGLEVLDPDGLLGDWLDPTLPGWYAALAGREAVVPLLDAAPDGAPDGTGTAAETPEQRWRRRQEALARADRTEQAARRGTRPRP